MRRRSSVLCALSLAMAAACVAGAAPARADIRVWEENEDDVWSHRWLASSALTQFGFIHRSNDPDSPSQDDQLWLRTARVGLRAQLHRYLQLRFELDGMPTPRVTDAYLEIPFHPALAVRVGQFLVPFLRANQVQEADQGFLDRALYAPHAPDRFALRHLEPRDVGLMLTGLVGNADSDVMSPALQYWAGAFLGGGATQLGNADEALLYTARVDVHLLGPAVGFDQEGDLASNERPHIAVGASVVANCDARGSYDRGVAFDTDFRYRGLYVYASFVRFYGGGVRNDSLGELLGYGAHCGAGPAGEGDHVAWGWSAQLQYVLPRLLFPSRTQALELLVRADGVAPQNAADGSFLGGGSSAPTYVAPPSFGDPDNSPSRWRLTFGVNWFPTRTQIMRLGINYQLQRETEDAVIAGRTVPGVDDDILWLEATAGF